MSEDRGPDTVGGSTPRPEVVDIWYYAYEDQNCEGLAEEQRQLMSADEQARCSRLRFACHRRMFVATRALVRTVLSEYASVPPMHWRFSTLPSGRPQIAGPEGIPPLHFSLAHTRGGVVCAVSGSCPWLGVDIERADRVGETLSIAEEFFAPGEIEVLRGLPAGQRERVFYRYWTLKESYVKARGLGLRLPLDQFAFYFDADGGIDLVFERGYPDNARAWRFVQLVERPYVIALGVMTAGRELKARLVPYTPLRGKLLLERTPSTESLPAS